MREFQFGLGSSRARGSLEESLSEDGEMEEFVQCVPGLYERPVAPINVSFFPSVLLFPSAARFLSSELGLTVDDRDELGRWKAPADLASRRGREC